jgi:hypothetical protein
MRGLREIPELVGREETLTRCGARAHAVMIPAKLAPQSRGRPRPRVAMMLRWISLEPL